MMIKPIRKQQNLRIGIENLSVMKNNSGAIRIQISLLKAAAKVNNKHNITRLEIQKYAARERKKRQNTSNTFANQVPEISDALEKSTTIKKRQIFSSSTFNFFSTSENIKTAASSTADTEYLIATKSPEKTLDKIITDELARGR